jgi:23S rRNA pseudouridine1911/1915/1917 synthase
MSRLIRVLSGLKLVVLQLLMLILMSANSSGGVAIKNNNYEGKNYKRPKRNLISSSKRNPHNVIPLRHQRLLKPKILFSSNHLLVVDKPPGWHSMPNSAEPSPKCLLSYLISQKLGGGSKQDFLKPLHRLDQPCTGVLLFGKTSKAASRIQSQWKKTSTANDGSGGIIQKTYHVVVVGQPSWRNAKQPTVLKASAARSSRPARKQPKNQNRSQSVRMIPDPQHGDYQITCRVVQTNTEKGFSLLEVQTNKGARHIIRAILSAYQIPIMGDLRYGNTKLPDASVALHASRVAFSIPLGNQTDYDFQAPLPQTWQQYFGFRCIQHQYQRRKIQPLSLSQK